MLPYLGLGGTGTVFIFLTRLGRLLVGTTIVIAVTSVMGFNTLTTSPTSLVASHSQAGTSKLGLVLLNSTDGSAHWGQKVTFTVSTTATDRPYVKLDCYQNGVWVDDQWAGFFADFAWPYMQTFPLTNATWTSGGANCTASLYYYSGKRTITVTTLNFQVLP